MVKPLPKKSKGFTLIELLVVISIIAILSTIGFIMYQGVQKKSRDARRKADLAQIKTYLELYYNDNHQYPPSPCGYDCNRYYYSNSGVAAWIPGLSSYISRLPLDPINNDTNRGPWNAGINSYAYGNVYDNGQTYDLTTKLEDTNDPDRCGIKDWKFLNATTHWCDGDAGTFGGSYPNEIYEVGPKR